jgi:hypothetical protein
VNYSCKRGELKNNILTLAVSNGYFFERFENKYKTRNKRKRKAWQ